MLECGSPYAQGEAQKYKQQLLPVQEALNDARKRYIDQTQANIFGKAFGHLNAAIRALDSMPK